MSQDHNTDRDADLMLPWVQGDSTPGDSMGDNACNIYDEESGANLIAKCDMPETAAYIITVVNAHSDLLRSLKDAHLIIKLESNDPATPFIRQMERAIAKGEAAP